MSTPEALLGAFEELTVGIESAGRAADACSAGSPGRARHDATAARKEAERDAVAAEILRLMRRGDDAPVPGYVRLDALYACEGCGCAVPGGHLLAHDAFHERS